MISAQFAQEFAQEWVDSWNSHNLDRIMSHCADDIEVTSPFIANLVQEPSGTLKGKENIRPYWAKALERYTDLHLKLIEVLVGVDSITVYHHGVLGKRVAEVFFFDGNQKILRDIAHYTP
jgi:ketosteroid isomerase-like protein